MKITFEQSCELTGYYRMVQFDPAATPEDAIRHVLDTLGIKYEIDRSKDLLVKEESVVEQFGVWTDWRE